MTQDPKFTFRQHTAAVKALAWCPFQTNLLATGNKAHSHTYTHTHSHAYTPIKQTCTRTHTRTHCTADHHIL